MTAFIEKLKTVYRKADEAGKVQAWLTLIGTAICSLVFVLIPFMIRGTYTVWTAAAGDAATQGVTYLRHVKEYGWLKAIGSFDFYMGLGADYLTSFSFFSLFDPFNLVFFILPFGDLMNYTLTMALKHLTCAVTMFAYLRHRGVANSKGIILSVAYMLTGFTAFTFVRHYNLTAGPIYLPLVLLGIEKIFQGKRPYVFIFSVFLTLVTNFYVFFSVTVFAVAYAIAYYFWNESAQGSKASVGGFFKRLLPVAGYYLLAVFLGGVMLAPNAYGYLNAARSASKGLDFFAFDVFFTQALSLTLPISAQHYSSMGVNIALAVLALYTVLKRNGKTRLHAWFVVALTIGYLLPVFGYAMNIFNYSNNRWSYGLSFFVFSLIGLGSQTEEEEYAEEDIKKINKILVVYLAVTLAAGLPALGETIGFSWWLILLSVVVAVLLGFGVYKLFKSGKTWRGIRKFYRPAFLYFLGFVLTLGCCGGYYIVYSGQHDGAEKYASLFSEQERYVSTLNQTEYFRTDAGNDATWYGCFENRGVNNRYYGTKAYNSITNKYVYEFLKENGVYNPTQNLGISGLDERFALQSLLSVKYSYNTRTAGHGFTPIAGVEHLYENENYLPLGFMVEGSYSEEYYLSQSVLERQYLLLSGVVLEEDAGTLDGSFDSGLQETVKAQAGRLKKGETLSFTHEVKAGEEAYFVLAGVGEVPRNTRIDVSCNGRVKQYYFAEKGDLMYSEQRTAYLSFGSFDEDAVLSFTTSLDSGSYIDYEHASVATLPTAKAESLISALQSGSSMTDLTVSENAVTGKIHAQTDGYLLLTIPYSDGWTAYVNGRKTEILRADTAFMALGLAAGEYEVKLVYETPLLSLGKTVSLLACGALVIYALGDETRRMLRRKKREE